MLFDKKRKPALKAALALAMALAMLLSLLPAAAVAAAPAVTGEAIILCGDEANVFDNEAVSAEGNLTKVLTDLVIDDGVATVTVSLYVNAMEDATNITVTDTLSGDVTFVGFSEDSASGYDGYLTESGGVITWDIGNPDAIAWISYTVSVKQSALNDAGVNEIFPGATTVLTYEAEGTETIAAEDQPFVAKTNVFVSKELYDYNFDDLLPQPVDTFDIGIWADIEEWDWEANGGGWLNLDGCLDVREYEPFVTQQMYVLLTIDTTLDSHCCYLAEDDELLDEIGYDTSFYYYDRDHETSIYWVNLPVGGNYDAIVENADVRPVVKAVDKDEAYAGETLAYTLYVRLDSFNEMKAMTVPSVDMDAPYVLVDELPDQTTLVEDSIGFDSTADYEWDVVDNTLFVSIDNEDNWSPYAIITYEVTINEGATGTVENNAVVTRNIGSESPRNKIFLASWSDDYTSNTVVTKILTDDEVEKKEKKKKKKDGRDENPIPSPEPSLAPSPAPSLRTTSTAPAAPQLPVFVAEPEPEPSVEQLIPSPAPSPDDPLFGLDEDNPYGTGKVNPATEGTAANMTQTILLITLLTTGCLLLMLLYSMKLDKKNK